MIEIFNLVKDTVIELVKRGEQTVQLSFYRLKRTIFRMAIELILFTIAVVFTLAGIVLVLSKYLPVEWVILIIGLLMLNASLLMIRFK
jgi:uncharacterized membrane protein YfcA